MKIDRQNGFSLIEVLVAIAIFSIGILTVISMMVTSLRATSYSRALTVANQLVQQKIEEVRARTFSTVVNEICGWGVPRPAGYTGVCPMDPANRSTVLVNRTAETIPLKYSVPGAAAGLSNVQYDVTLQRVFDFPVNGKTDMITVTVQWNDQSGPHTVTAITYMDK